LTIYDIAREANVSASTVSRVINNKPGIKAETRVKVREILDKYRRAAQSSPRACAFLLFLRVRGTGGYHQPDLKACRAKKNQENSPKSGIVRLLAHVISYNMANPTKKEEMPYDDEPGYVHRAYQR